MKRVVPVLILLCGCDGGREDVPADLPTSASGTTTSATGDATASSGTTAVTLSEPTTSNTGSSTTGSDDSESDSEGGPVNFDLGPVSDVGSLGPTSCNDGTVILTATLRDFASTHPDFESFWGAQASPDLVLADLGADDLPVHNPAAPLPPATSSSTQITSADSFSEWYADVADVNVTTSFEFELTEDPPGSGLFVFDDGTFFPLDDMGWNAAPGPNNETLPDANGEQHNFHFTTEIHTTFEYEAGQLFTFIGDDDLWVFVDGQRVIDLGGLHGELEGSVDLDTLGLNAGETYTMDIFHAERRHDGSHFRIETSIQCFTPPAG